MWPRGPEQTDPPKSAKGVRQRLTSISENEAFPFHNQTYLRSRGTTRSLRLLESLHCPEHVILLQKSRHS